MTDFSIGPGVQQAIADNGDKLAATSSSSS
jgi:hypothetical protein